MARPLPSSPRPYYSEPINEDRLEALVAIIKPRLIKRVVGLPRVGGLHHRYGWQRAA